MNMECKEMNMECKDRFEACYSREDIELIRKLIFRKRFRKKTFALLLLTLYLLLINLGLPRTGSEEQSVVAFLNGTMFLVVVSWLMLLIKCNRQKKKEISRCGMRHIEVKIYDGWFSVSQYSMDWKSGEIYIRPQDIDTVWRDSNFTLLLREGCVICSLKNSWFIEHPELAQALTLNGPMAGTASASSAVASVTAPAPESEDVGIKQSPDSFPAENQPEKNSKKKQTALLQIVLIVIFACVGVLMGYGAASAFNADLQRINLEYNATFPEFSYTASMLSYSLLMAAIPTGQFLYAPFSRSLIQKGVGEPARILIRILCFPLCSFAGTVFVIPFLIYKIVTLASK